MKPIYLILFSLLTFATCKSPKLKYCESEYKLIQADTLPMIELDFDQSEADFETQLLKGLEIDSICGGSKIVGLPLDLKSDGFHKSFGAVNIPVVFYNHCRDKNEPIHLRLEQYFYTFINADNEALIDGNPAVLEKDSIIKRLQQKWESDEMDFFSFQNTQFRISTSTEAKSQTLKIIINAYTQFYLKKLAEYCRKAHDVKLCNANKTIIEELKTIYPFKVHICYTLDCSFSPLPPPPPPLQEN